jgi:hypothetical protein
MNRTRFLSALAAVVMLLAGWVSPASAQIRLDIRVNEAQRGPGDWRRGLGVDQVIPFRIGDQLGLDQGDLIWRVAGTGTMPNGMQWTVSRRTTNLGNLLFVLDRADADIAVEYRRQGLWYRTTADIFWFVNGGATARNVVTVQIAPPQGP